MRWCWSRHAPACSASTSRRDSTSPRRSVRTAGSIGRRYRRQDEAGTPWCVTVDGQTAEDGTVTIRDRDTLEQVRVAEDRVLAWVRERL